MSSTDASTTTPDSDETNSTESGLHFPWRKPPERSFDDVGGLKDAKQIFKRAIIDPLHGDTERYRRFRVPVPNVLLHGPPGTGKTYLAEAVAGEASAPWVRLSGSALQSKWINESTTLVNRLYKESKRVGSEYGYAIVVLEEIDSIIPRRGASGHHAEDVKVTNEFLRFLDNTQTQPFVVIATTNRPDALDAAATREGRIDRRIHLGLPDSETRRAILEQHLQKRPSDVPEDILVTIANRTEDWTAAALEQLVVESARVAAHQGANLLEPAHLDVVLSTYPPM